jgi:hypothetical protein
MSSVPDESARAREDAPKWAGLEEGGGVQAQCFFQVVVVLVSLVHVAVEEGGGFSHSASSRCTGP